MDEDLIQISVGQVMTKNVIAAVPSNKFSQLLEFFAVHSINHMPVIDNGKIVGIVSAKDILRAIYAKAYQKNGIADFQHLDSEITVGEIMSKDPITVSPDATLEEAKNLLGRNSFRALPVVQDGKLVGIFTTKDLAKIKIIKIEGSDYNPI